jgi:hypothetical protein
MRLEEFEKTFTRRKEEMKTFFQARVPEFFDTLPFKAESTTPLHYVRFPLNQLLSCLEKGQSQLFEDNSAVYFPAREDSLPFEYNGDGSTPHMFSSPQGAEEGSEAIGLNLERELTGSLPFPLFFYDESRVLVSVDIARGLQKVGIDAYLRVIRQDGALMRPEIAFLDCKYALQSLQQ